MDGGAMNVISEPLITVLYRQINVDDIRHFLVCTTTGTYGECPRLVRCGTTEDNSPARLSTSAASEDIEGPNADVLVAAPVRGGGTVPPVAESVDSLDRPEGPRQ